MIYDILPVNNYSGNDNCTKFDFDFYIENEFQLKVYHFDKNSIKTELTYNVDYSINEFLNPNGSYIIFPLETSKFSVLKSDENISLELSLPVSQETQYNNSSLLNLSELEYSFDYLTRLIQILARKLELCVKVSECSDVYPEELIDEIDKKVKAVREYLLQCNDDKKEVSKNYSSILQMYNELIDIYKYVQSSNPKLNKPFFFGQSHYFEATPNNASWLKSSGQWNTKAMYPDFYNWLLEQRNKGMTQIYGWQSEDGRAYFWTLSEKPKVNDAVLGYAPRRECGKISEVNQDTFTFTNTTNNRTYTLSRLKSQDVARYIAQNMKVNILTYGEFSAFDDVDDYNPDFDYIINTDNETFRLPLLNGEENLPSGKQINLTLQAADTHYFPKQNGFVFIMKQATAMGQYLNIYQNPRVDEKFTSSAGQFLKCHLFVKRGMYFGVGYKADGELRFFRFEPAVGAGDLYYYVGDTVQNADLINAGVVLEQIANINSKINSQIHITDTYSNGSSGYRLWSDGYCEQWGRLNATGSALVKTTVNLLKPYPMDNNYQILLSCGINALNSTQHIYCSWKNKTTSSFEFQIQDAGSSVLPSQTYGNWYTCGYIN